MSEIMDLVVIEKKNAMAVFTNNDQLDPLIEAIEKEARSLVPDVTTKKGRDAIASMAHKVARSKTYIDNAGKDLVAELKALPKQIDESRRVVRERLDALKDEVRRPLTEWEAEQERIKAEEADRIRREAEQREQARLAEEKRKADEQARREADVKHRKTVGTDIVKALVANTSLTRDQAIEVLTTVKDGRIPHTAISY
ncbi:TolA protein [Klebsiella pneumoniae]|nr:TolA protein [Klebsiella pneumoniae]